VETPSRVFAAASAASAAGVVILGWTTGVRQVMHAALLGIAAVAFLPFVLIAAGLFSVLSITFVVALAAAGHDMPIDHVHGAGEALLEGGAWLTPRYYRFLRQRRHPLFWAVPGGALLGGLLLWALLALVVMPKEARVARDAFDRPLVYRVSGIWQFASYTLTSLGFDGKPSDDDLCVSGATKLAHLAEQASDLGDLVEALRSGHASTRQRWASIRSLSCRR
jgi:hypothetical protein